MKTIGDQERYVLMPIEDFEFFFNRFKYACKTKAISVFIHMLS